MPSTALGAFAQRCHIYGHWSNICPENNKFTLCGKDDHLRVACPLATKNPSGSAAAKRSSAESVDAVHVPPKRPTSSRMSSGFTARGAQVPFTGTVIGSYVNRLKGIDTHDLKGPLEQQA